MKKVRRRRSTGEGPSKKVRGIRSIGEGLREKVCERRSAEEGPPKNRHKIFLSAKRRSDII